jgi:ABC-2 type transport system permease protein
VIRHALRAYPQLLRIGLSEMVAYRAEFLVWILTTNMPLVMMALWNAVAADGPIGRLGQKEMRLYFLATLVVRILTSSWMVWELTMDIRGGKLASRLLRPLHPLLAYSAQHLAAVPLRLLVVSPVVVILLLVMGQSGGISGAPLWPLLEPQRLLILVASLAGAWLLLFFSMVIIGSLAMFVDSALSVFELWLGIHFVLSGYLVPIELIPAAWAHAAARALPFWYSLGFPVETAVGMLDLGAAAHALGVQWLYVAVFALAANAVWRAGMRRFVAFGG